MPSYTGNSNVPRKRKNPKANTKQTEASNVTGQQQQQQQLPAYETKQQQQEQNERLKRQNATSDKKQQQQRLTVSPTPSSSSSLCCNGAISAAATFVNCCRDTNCNLNNDSNAADSETGFNEYLNDNRDRRSASHLSTQTKPTTASISSKNETPPSRTSKPLQSPERDGSPDSGVSSDGDRLLAQQQLQQKQRNISHGLIINLKFDLISWFLFALAFVTRFYKLATPRNIVFDEIHYGKYVSHYMRNVFFFDQHPPLGKQLIAAVVGFAGYDGNYTYPHIGAEYSDNVPIYWMRFVPALCGSLLAPATYKLLLTAHLNRWTAMLGGLLVILDNALLTQSRFVLMESMLLLFCALGLQCLLSFHRSHFISAQWLMYGIAAAICFTCATSIKYIGFLSCFLAAYLMWRYFWNLLYDATVSDAKIWLETFMRFVMFVAVPIGLYLGIFYVHLQQLHRAGPHDSVMTSAFQASLDGGLASITRGQPLRVVHGSQITLRNTYGRTCWLHSHAHVYPVRYPDKRGSSHQQQVTCYSFKDVNNWWIVKRPNRDDLVVGEEPDEIRHGDIIQLVHGITSRGLNSHNVAAPVTPQAQEVSCYIDYEIKMPSELLWRVDILNRDAEGSVWHAIKSEVRLIHETTSSALRFTGRQLPEWGFNQHEVVADRTIENRLAIWNVEEHRYTKTQDQRERERQLLSAEMIPTKKTSLSFWDKFIELQSKMFWNTKNIESHMYSSEPHEWPLLDKGIAYWANGETGAQIHLLGNILIWYTGTLTLSIYATLLIFYLIRRRRLCYDLPADEWQRFLDNGDIFFVGYLIHYLPYYFVDRTLFLHHYLPAFLFKLLLLCYVIEHIDYLFSYYCTGRWSCLVRAYRLSVLLWLVGVVIVFLKFLPLSNGLRKLTTEDILKLRWKDTWDLIF